MSNTTENLNLFKWDPINSNDLNAQFDLNKSLNENWDKIDEAVGENQTNKVDKEIGKGLSTNDFTDGEKNKLSGIEAGANKTIVDSTMSETSTNPVQNKVVKVALENKVNKETGKSLISDTEIERLAGVDNYDDTEVRQKITAIETEQITQNEDIDSNANEIIANAEEIEKLKQKNAILKSQFPMRRGRRREYYFDR